MESVSSRDLRNLLRAVSVLNESLELSTFAQRAVTAVARVLPTDLVTYNEVDLLRRTDRIFISPGDTRLAPDSPEYSAFIRHIDEHPLIAHNARKVDPVPRKISDFLSARHFRSLGLYSEFFRDFDVNYQMAIVMRHGGKQIIGIAANRALSDFTERERTCLALLRSHLMQTYRHGLVTEQMRAEPCVAREAAAARAAALGHLLTQREAEVLCWVARGKSNDDVARIIGATSATVKKHLEHVYAKLGVTNRTAASALYFAAP